MDSFASFLRRGAVLLAFLGTIAAQQPTGEIRLDLRDPSGAAVQASGVLRNAAGGPAQSFETDSQGSYRFQALPYGRYRIEISKTGFANLTLSIDVQSPTPVSRTVILALAHSTSKVDVIS